MKRCRKVAQQIVPKSNRKPTHMHMEIKWEFDKNVPVLFLNLLRSKVNRSCSTMQKPSLCRHFVRKFHNAFFYVICLAFHC